VLHNHSGFIVRSLFVNLLGDTVAWNSLICCDVRDRFKLTPPKVVALVEIKARMYALSAGNKSQHEYRIGGPKPLLTRGNQKLSPPTSHGMVNVEIDCPIIAEAGE
jgi:hypothetical protein